MEPDPREQIALLRFGVIAEAVNPDLTPAERGVIVRALAARAHHHPDGVDRRYSRATLDRFVRAYRKSGLSRRCP